MATPSVDLSAINPLAEIIVRGGDASAPNARRVIQGAYIRVDPAYPDAVGLPSLFRPGATLDELAREGSFPHQKLSFSVVGKIAQELAIAGFELVLFVTPTARFPDHHSLSVARNGIKQRSPTMPPMPAERRTPARVRRAFSHLRPQLGTPANAPKPCGRSPGRPKGKRSQPATRFPAIKLTVQRSR